MNYRALVPVWAALIIVLSLGRPAAADHHNMTLAWDPAQGAVAGYVLSYGTAPGSYSKYVDVGLKTEFAVAGLNSGTTYYFAVRAYDASGQLSPRSEEVFAKTPGTIVAEDTTPDAFAFASVSGVDPGTLVTSNPITVSGINAPAPIAIAGGAFSIDGGAFTASATTVTNGQTVAVRLTSGSGYEQGVSAALTIGGVSASFNVTTKAAPVEEPTEPGDDVPAGDEPIDTTPDSFGFGRVLDADLNTIVTSRSATITGINAPALIEISRGTFSIDGGPFTAGPATVTNGQTVVVQVTSSSSYDVEVKGRVTVGGVLGVFRVKTAAGPPADTTPDAFTFVPVSGVSPNTVQTSNPVVVSGINKPSPIAITAGAFSIDGGAFTASPAMVTNGQTVVVQLTSASGYEQLVSAVLTIGGVSASFEVTTEVEPDFTPDAFAFGAVTDVSLDTVVTSNAIVVSGINVPAPMALSAGAVSVDGGPFAAAPATVTNGQTVVLQLTSASGHEQSVSAVLTIGGVSASFRVTTEAAPVPDEPVDTTPDSFGFGRVMDASLNTVYTSRAATITGINTPTPIVIDRGAYSIDNGPFVSGSSTVTNGQTVVVQLASADTYAKELKARVTIGGVRGVFRVKTAAAPDGTPEAPEAPAESEAPVELPEAPAGLVSSVRDGRTIELAWDASESHAAGFRIEVGSAPGLADVSSFTTGRTSRFALSDLAPGTYVLRVRGVVEGGIGDASDEVTVTVEGAAPGAPGMPADFHYQVQGASVIFSWTAPAEGGVPTRYTVEATDADGNPLATIDTGNTMTMLLHDAGGSGVYVARVRAANSSGAGPASLPITVVIP